MARCVNMKCNKDPLKSPDRVLWGCDADFCCNQECYEAARRQMDYVWGDLTHREGDFQAWLRGADDPGMPN